MDLSRAISEPMARQIVFHDAFNRNVKLAVGALVQYREQAQSNRSPQGEFALPNGGEPWGVRDKWRNLDAAIPDAQAFISEIGLVRAASAFEDYLIGVTAELDRWEDRARTLGRAPEPRRGGGDEPDDTEETVRSLRRVERRLNLDMAELAADVTMVRFFEVARNCVVHRSGRASHSLAEMRASGDMAEALRAWPRRIGKWTVGVPDATDGVVVAWQPRHAILASAVYYHCAKRLDAAVVSALGTDGIVTMAAHWGLLNENPAPCAARINAESLIRTLLMGRYCVRDASIREIVDILRSAGIWADARKAFEDRGLVTLKQARRRAAREATRQGKGRGGK
jgi:hypothetical protein